ncbi:hypothetical protein A0256_17145 [Mucilaginibacter sp. PAMC 26640]|nr:hypothetical protein A0256_17145 [Mucilaginibacter sp. PAMC 26640]
MKTRAVLCFLTFSLAACKFGNAPATQKGDVFKDTLAYSYQKITERGADCGDKADSLCSSVKLTFPVFKGQRALNDSIARKLTGMFVMQGKPDSSIQEMTRNFLKSYTSFKKSNPKSQMFYTLNSYAKIIDQDSALVALEYGGYTFQGGAHGSSFTGFLNWNPKANKQITIDEILIDGYKAQLNKAAERIFRKDEKLKDTSSLARDYFFKDNKFALNENYLLTPIGIRFVYNQYEIKPYAAGQTEIIIPYADIKTLIRPNAVIAQYVK